MALNKQEIEVLRQLAQEYAEIAALPEQNVRREMWLKLNSLHMERPMVLIDQIPWGEMDVDGSLKTQVQDPYWNGVENELRQTLYKWRHMRVDMVVNPYISLPRPIINTGWGLEQKVDRLQRDTSTGAASQHIHNQIHGYEDIDKIQMPRITLDKQREDEIIQTAHQLFDGIIDFKMTGVCMHLGIWDTIAYWMGVENCYIEIMDRPEMIHTLMEKLTQGLIFQIEQMNEQGLFDITSNLCHCSQTFTHDLPRPGSESHPQSQDAWAFGLAQLFTSVAPAITHEFEVDYMKRVFPYFGAIYYGCCDRLDDRLDIIEQLPKVRKISCSPWSDRERFAANLPGRYVMSNKPTPAFLAYDQLDEQMVRDDLRRTMQAAGRHGVNLEFILKDISTVRHDPKRLWRWAELAMEEVCR